LNEIVWEVRSRRWGWTICADHPAIHTPPAVVEPVTSGTVHLCYVDESGSTGSDLSNAEQPVFTMAGLLVSDEKWRRTEKAVRDCLVDALGDVANADDFELHAADLLAPTSVGAFSELNREERNHLALSLLEIPANRNHQVLLQVVHKSTAARADPPDSEYGFDWNHPWDLALAATFTMFEDFLRSSRTGSTSTGMIFIDHEEAYLELVRRRSEARRSAVGWRKLNKVMEIGYSAVSHTNAMIQLVDLIAFTMRKHAESFGNYRSDWPEEAHVFYRECHDRIWPRVLYKQLKFTKLTVPTDFCDHLKSVRKGS
jgi:hypothetical protein